MQGTGDTVRPMLFVNTKIYNIFKAKTVAKNWHQRRKTTHTNATCEDRVPFIVTL